MVVTRGQTGSDGPVTPTANQAAPVRSNPNVSIPPEVGSAGICGERTVSTDPTASAANGTQISQAETTTRSTQMGSTLRSGLPWLPTDDESGTEPEDPYSQGDRPDPLKTDWERTVGGGVGGNRRLAPPCVLLVKEADYREGRILTTPAYEPVMSQDCTESVHLLLTPVQVPQHMELREAAQQITVSLKLMVT